MKINYFFVQYNGLEFFFLSYHWFHITYPGVGHPMVMTSHNIQLQLNLPSITNLIYVVLHKNLQIATTKNATLGCVF